jgi:hypothetical protein
VNLTIDDYDVFIHNCEWFLNGDGELDSLYKAYETEAELYEEAYKLALMSAGATAAECAAGTGYLEGTLWLVWEGEDTHWISIDPQILYPDEVDEEGRTRTNHAVWNGDVIIFGRCEYFVSGEDETTEIVDLHDEPSGDSGLHD